MPTTTSPKPAIIPVRLTPAQAAQVAELTAAGWGNQSDVIRTAIDRMHQQEIRKMKRDDIKIIAKRIHDDLVKEGKGSYGGNGWLDRSRVAERAIEEGYSDDDADEMGEYIKWLKE